MESASESTQQEEASAKGPLHEEHVPVDNDVSITSSDVLCGRGKTSFNHVGNKRFRELISASLTRYMQAENRFEKSIVIHTIVDRIQLKGGRFLKQNSATGSWMELQEQQAKEKVGHAMRDAVNSFEARRARESNAKQLKEPPRSSTTRLEHSQQQQQVAPSTSIALHQYNPSLEGVYLASRTSIQQSPFIGGQTLGLPAAAALMDYHHHHQHPHDLGQLQQQPHELQGQQLPHFRPLQQEYAGHLQQHAGHRHQLQPDQGLSQFHQNPSEPQGGEEKEKHEHHFLQHIDEVLGPLPPNAEDPMEPFLDEHNRRS